MSRESSSRRRPVTRTLFCFSVAAMAVDIVKSALYYKVIGFKKRLSSLGFRAAVLLRRTDVEGCFESTLKYKVKEFGGDCQEGRGKFFNREVWAGRDGGFAVGMWPMEGHGRRWGR